MIKRSIGLDVPHDKNGFVHVRIRKEKAQSPHWELLSTENPAQSAELQINRGVARELLARFVLGYSSGENEVLSLPFFKMRFIHFDEYYDRLLGQLDYDGKPEGRLVYLDRSFSQAILICNLLLQPPEILQPVCRRGGRIEDIKSFRIIIRQASGWCR